jgi:tetratricopeptide (TPR) repeat protein
VYAERPRPEDQAEAERLLDKALRLDPGLADAHAARSRISVYLYTLGIEETPARLETAVEEARRAVALAPDDARARAALTTALAVSDHLTPALEEGRRAVALDASSAEAWLALGIVLRLRHQLAESLEACRRAAAIAPDSPRVLTGLGEALRETEHYAAAREMFGQAIDLDHEAIVPQLAAASSLLKAGNVTEARLLFGVITDRWTFGQNRTRLGVAAMLVAMQDYEAALGTYGQLDLPEGSSLPTLLALYGKGYCLLRLGRDAEAEYFLSLLTSRAPDEYDGPARGREILFRAYQDLIDYFKGRGRDRKVESLLRAACRRPLAPTPLARQLSALLAARGAREEAAMVLEKALLGSDPLEDALETSDSILDLARLRQGGTRRKGGDDAGWHSALDLAAERIASSPFGVAHYRLARSQALAQENAAALKSLQEAARNGYLPLDLMVREPDFEALRGDPAFQALLKR